MRTARTVDDERWRPPDKEGLMWAVPDWLFVFVFFAAVFTIYSVPVWIFLALIHYRSTSARVAPAPYPAIAILTWVIACVAAVAIPLGSHRVRAVDWLLQSLGPDVEPWVMVLSPMMVAVLGPALVYGHLRMRTARDPDYEDQPGEE